MLNLLSCISKNSEESYNWFFTPVFQYENAVKDQTVTQIYLIDENTGFLTGTDKMKVKEAGGNIKDQSAIFFRSTDGGKTFEKQILGKGYLEHISQSSDMTSTYMVCARFSESDIRTATNFEILKSSDFGQTWELLYLFKNKMLDKVFFYNNMIGIASVIQDPFGYDSPALYKTTDGGKNWRITPVFMENKTLSLITSEGIIMGRYMDQRPEIWKMDINRLEIENILLEIPESLVIFGTIQEDPVTKFHYCKLRIRDENKIAGNPNEYFLYCVENKEMITLPSPAYYVYIYGDHISVWSRLKSNQFVAEYYYSQDKGRNWENEILDNIIVSGAPGMYGEGYVWSMSSSWINEVYCPLVVRIPPEKEK